MPKQMKTERLARDGRAMMQDPRRWARWPWLPMKRRIGGSSAMQEELGCLHADDTGPGMQPKVWLVNIFMTGWFPNPDHPHKTYADFDALLADGWQVD